MIEGETALVTGAAGGMGFEIVTRLLDIPHITPIYAIDINPAVLTKFSRYPNVIAIQADVRSRGQIDKVFERIALGSPRLGLVVNAAGEIFAPRISCS